VVVEATEALTMGAAFTDFIGPVISRSAYDRVSGYIKEAESSVDVAVLAGGVCDDSKGFYIRPTVLETKDPLSNFMTEEIFGPVVCIYVYNDADFGPKIFTLIDESTQYALSGAVFAKSRAAIIEATEELRFSAGNFYIKYVRYLQPFLWNCSNSF
jgi:1-pyrroline-5-carboxylate dehydrogenase